MNKIIKTVEDSLNNSDFYSVLYVSLALIGTCSVKEYPSIRKDRERYIDWINNYYLPLFENDVFNPMIESLAIYKFRCSVLHESTNVWETDSKNKISKIILTNTGSHRNKSFVKNATTEIIEIQVDVELFVRELLEAIVSWKENAEKRGISTVCDFTIFNEIWNSSMVGGAQEFQNCK